MVLTICTFQAVVIKYDIWLTCPSLEVIQIWPDSMTRYCFVLFLWGQSHCELMKLVFDHGWCMCIWGAYSFMNLYEGVLVGHYLDFHSLYHFYQGIVAQMTLPTRHVMSLCLVSSSTTTKKSIWNVYFSSKSTNPPFHTK